MERELARAGMPPLLRDVAFIAPLVSLCACATLPAEEATAFRKIARADKIAFVGITEVEREALTGMAVRQTAANNGTILSEHCGAAQKERCKLSYRFADGAISLEQSAPKMRRLIAAISDYGDRMADLAEAKDIDQAVGNAKGAADAAASLAAVVGVPFVKPALDALVLVLRGNLVAKRRRLMLENALAAQPVIRAAAERMQRLARPMRQNIAAAASIDIEDAADGLGTSKDAATTLEARIARLRTAAARGDRSAQAQLDAAEQRLDALHAARAAQAEAMIRAGNAMNAARGIDPDFSGLAGGHDQLVAELERPKGNPDAALADLGQFLDVLGEFADEAGS